MSDIFVILPDQLFWTNEALAIIINDSITHVYMLEDPAYFTKHRYHTAKLVLHRASMQRYYKMLQKYTKVSYVDYKDISTDWIDYISTVKPLSVEMFYPNSMDEWGNKPFVAEFNGLRIKMHESPAFLMNYSYIRDEFDKNNLTFSKFYKQVRKQFFPQLNPRDDKGAYHPIGGQWMHSMAGRRPITPNTKTTRVPALPDTADYTAAIRYVRQILPNHNLSNHNLPTLGEPCRYPIDGQEAIEWLMAFLQTKLNNYPHTQLTTVITTPDSLDNVSKTLHHSVLSSSLNCGILTPKQVLNELFKIYANDGGNKLTPSAILSLETFFRQIIRREYIYSLYVNTPSERRGSVKIPTKYTTHNTLSPAWFSGDTQMEPIDILIKDVLKTGYLHHAPRLYWLCGYMMLQQVSIENMYNWFMCMCIDAYPWSVIPNIVLNYNTNTLKLSSWLTATSNLKRTKDISWHGRWDTLYYYFIYSNARVLPKLIQMWKDKPIAERKNIIQCAEKLLIERPKVKAPVKAAAKASTKAAAKASVKASTKASVKATVKASAKAAVKASVKASTKARPRVKHAVKPFPKHSPKK